MNRTIRSAAFCLILLAAGFVFLHHTSAARGDAIADLLRLPAPPPPNPLVQNFDRARSGDLADDNKPPDDDAPIDEIIAYWTRVVGGGPRLRLTARPPSEKVLGRLMAEMSDNPDLAIKLLVLLPDNKEAGDLIKALYDRAPRDDNPDRSQRLTFRRWLETNSGYFSQDLERKTQGLQDTNGYVDSSGETNLLALTRHDFARAEPILNRLYNDPSQPVSKTLATWALYRHALETDSIGDIDRYRSELMRLVENKDLSDGVRDKANDALTHERDFPGRDDWTFSLFEDKTLVEMPRFTMLTTMFSYAPPEKYAPRLIALVEKTPNITVRTAAVRNLLTILPRTPGTDLQRQIVQCLLPGLDDPGWVRGLNFDRRTIIYALRSIKLPESVPGLLKVLDEKAEAKNSNTAPGASTPAGAAERVISSGARESFSVAPANAAPPYYRDDEETYPYRVAAIDALAKQEDRRAVPALRRVLHEVETSERRAVVIALLASGGFSINEQMDAIEDEAKGNRAAMDYDDASTTTASAYARVGSEDSRGVARVYTPRAYVSANAANAAMTPPQPITAADIKALLGKQLLETDEIGDDLAQALVEKIDSLDQRDPRLSEAYRRIILRWQNSVINRLLLRDVARGRADADAIVRLLAQRKELREKQPADIAAVRADNAMAIGIGACLDENRSEYDAILEAPDQGAKTAMLACARLIRAQLPIGQVAALQKSENKLLASAAELYLESEDSAEARSIVLALHPNEAKILGATVAFYAPNSLAGSPYLATLFATFGGNSTVYGLSGVGKLLGDPAEKKLQNEIKTDLSLQGVYGYESNYVRIYKDKVVYSWEEDEARYRERTLSKDEFDRLRSYLAQNRVDELAPFLSSCDSDPCGSEELVMLSRAGGRRVFWTGPKPKFFAGLEKYFQDLRLTPATLKYNLSKEVPGLEILLADDDLAVKTVWGDVGGPSVLVLSAAQRRKLKADFETIEESNAERVDVDVDGDDADGYYERLRQKERDRGYDGFVWHKMAGSTLGDAIAQPEGVDFIPPRDDAPVPAESDAWKARTGEIELRGGYRGLFKLVRGKATKLQDGVFSGPVISANGRWAMVTRSTEDDGSQLRRVNLLTNKTFPVEVEGYNVYTASAYIPAVDKFLLEPLSSVDGYGEWEPGSDEAADEVTPNDLKLLDPNTGVMTPAPGEFRPLTQQTFRPLQKAARQNEFWAAIPDRKQKETVVGIYNSNNFGFKAMLRVPKVIFDSMSMWVDERAGKVYFVYRGHLLALPLSPVK